LSKTVVADPMLTAQLSGRIAGRVNHKN